MTSTDADRHTTSGGRARRGRPTRRVERTVAAGDHGVSATAVTGVTVGGVPVVSSARHQGAAGGRRRDWLQRYVRRLAVTDTVIVAAAVAVAQLVRFGVDVDGATRTEPSYTGVSVVLVVLWLVFLGLFRTRDRRLVGEGAEEYRRILDASLRLFGVVAIISLLLGFPFARGYLLIAFPLGLVGLCLGRRYQRLWLLRRREEGGHVSRVLVVGAQGAARTMARSFQDEPAAGYLVVGVCVPGFDGERGTSVDVDGRRVPVLGDELAVLDGIALCGADTVAVTATEHLGHDRMRELAWELEAVDVDLVVSPGVVDVAGPRLKIRPVAGLPLLHVEEPQYEGASRVSKWVFDRALAGLALVAASPVLAVAAVAIKLTSPGPALYRSERVGINGDTFAMLKLRTMEEDADRRVVELADANNGSGPLFKIRNDPRVTRVGRVLRKFSVDELPQLVNVLRGDMSIVGPRPPLRREVDTYSGHVHRRLLVKPGITGLWQVSGRSNLSWDESVRLDLSYVENWSMVQDLVIVWRTVRAVVGSRGAY